MDQGVCTKNIESHANIDRPEEDDKRYQQIFKEAYKW